jgi:hypothetical protein
MQEEAPPGEGASCCETGTRRLAGGEGGSAGRGALTCLGRGALRMCYVLTQSLPGEYPCV